MYHLLFVASYKNTSKDSWKLYQFVQIKSFYGLYFLAFRLNKDIVSLNLLIQSVYPVNIRIQSEYGKTQTKKTPKSDAVGNLRLSWKFFLVFNIALVY